MAKKRLAVEQIIQKLREAELELARGQTVPQLLKKIGVTEQHVSSLAKRVRRSANGSSEAVQGVGTRELAIEATLGRRRA